MSSFGKGKYTKPIMANHNDDISKDWYVFFQFKHEQKIYKFKRREGINRIKVLNEKLAAIEELRDEIEYDLKNGWNPFSDPKREFEYLPNKSNDKIRVTKTESKILTKREILSRLLKQKGK